MKKFILKVALIALFAGTLVSCDEDTVTYGGQNFVSFDKVASTRLIALEDGGDSETAINLAFPLSTDLVIEVDVKPVIGQEGVDYTVPSKLITIPAGETTANFVLTAIDNTITNDSKIIEIKILSTNNPSIAVGLNDIGSPYKRMVLLNEDCTTRFTDLLGSWEVFDAGDLAYLGDAEIDINDNGDCNILRISGIVDNIIANPTDTYIEITLAPQNGNATRGTFTSYQQLICAECWVNSANDGLNETLVIQPSGNFITTGTQQITLNGVFDTASGFYTGISSSVILKRAVAN